MSEKEPARDFETYEFLYVHPASACIMSGDVILRNFSAATPHHARILAENTPVICDGCGHNYKLQ